MVLHARVKKSIDLPISDPIAAVHPSRTAPAPQLPPPAPTELAERRASRKDFTWSYTDEPHATRRRLILAKYPEIRELFGTEPLTFPIVVLIFLFQLFVAHYLSESSWPVILAVAWAVGGTLNHSLQLAVHELSHNLCWSTPNANKLTAIFANLVTGVPSSVSFQKYHMDHHQWQGVDGIDTDIPTAQEVTVFYNTVMKLVWIIMQPLFYALRPTIVVPKSYGKWEILNAVVQITFNVVVFYTLGSKALAYLVIGTILGLGLHPSAGHFIAEHYEFVSGQETYSYYGICNYVNFNVGYHNEHHDFPRIPWSRLPLVTKIAPEFYLGLPHYDSYWKVFWTYITDAELGPHARIKRATKHMNSTADQDGVSIATKDPRPAVGSTVGISFAVAAFAFVLLPIPLAVYWGIMS